MNEQTKNKPQKNERMKNNNCVWMRKRQMSVFLIIFSSRTRTRARVCARAHTLSVVSMRIGCCTNVCVMAFVLRCHTYMIGKWIVFNFSALRLNEWITEREKKKENTVREWYSKSSRRRNNKYEGVCAYAFQIRHSIFKVAYESKKKKKKKLSYSIRDACGLKRPLEITYMINAYEYRLQCNNS